MTAYVYIEGGTRGPSGGESSSKSLKIECQKAFHSLLGKLGFMGRMPRLVACGGRQKTYEMFCTEHKAQKATYVAMWIDAEEPMEDVEEAWKHLSEVETVPAWSRPENAEDDQVLFMTTSMETWIVADRETLRRHYRQNLNENPLPALFNIEKRPRKDMLKAIETATTNCTNGYKKGSRSFEVLEKVDVDVLRKHLPSFRRVERILKTKLQLP